MHVTNLGIVKSFWAEVLAYVCYHVNRLPSSAIGGKTHVKVWSERVAQDYDSLQIFSCPAYYHVKEDKLDPRARKGVFIGFNKGVKGYKNLGSKVQEIYLEQKCHI